MQLLAPTPWGQITKALKSATKRQVVTAYLGTGASVLLPLKKGDRLIVNASEANVRSGTINPAELERFRKRGIKLYHVAHLHAKIYLADSSVIIGSPNASGFSEKSLIEACVLVKSTGLANSVSHWIDTLSLVPILKDKIDHLKTLYKPPKWESAGVPAKQTDLVATSWVTCIAEVDDTGELDEYSEAVGERHGIEESDVYSISSSQYAAASTMAKLARPGDEIFVVDHTDGRTVRGPYRLIEKARTRKVGKLFVSMFAMQGVDTWVAFSTFRNAAKRGGTAILASGWSTKRLKPSAAVLVRKAITEN